jgi:hypothetical protein
MKIKSKIIICAYENNINGITDQKLDIKKNFDLYIENVINNSYPLIRLSYNIVIYLLVFTYFTLLLFLFDKKKEKKIIKFLLKKIEKIIFFNKVFKLIKVYSIVYYYG